MSYNQLYRAKKDIFKVKKITTNLNKKFKT